MGLRGPGRPCVREPQDLLYPQPLGDLEQDLAYTGLSLHVRIRGSQTLLAVDFVYAQRKAGVGGVPAVVWDGEGLEAH